MRNSGLGERMEGSRTPSRATAPAWLFLGYGGLLVLGYAVAPPALQVPLFVLMVLSSVVAMVTGVLRNQPPGRRGPWWAVTASAVPFVGAAVLRVVLPGGGPRPSGLAGGASDLAVIPGYLLMLGALLVMSRRRRAGEDDPARSDAVLLGLAAALGMWAFLIAPQLGMRSMPVGQQVLTALFPMIDVLLLVIVAHLMLARGVRTASLWLFGTSFGAMLVGDLLYAVLYAGLSRAVALPKLFDLLSMVAYLTMAAAAQHPTMRTLTEPQSVVTPRFGATRTAGIAALLVSPMVVNSVSPPPDGWSAVVRVALTASMTVAVVARIVRSNNRRAAAECAARQAEQAERWRATHDALTHLPNRELLAETIVRWGQDATNAGQEISLLFLDLDRFKQVNDSWGHRVGDELLCAVAGRLAGMVRSEDLVCRIGGDEFVIAMGSSTPAALAESLAQRLVDEFARPFALSVGDVTISPSIGLARSPGAGEALELIRDSDTAMYQAKGAGGNGYACYDSAQRDAVRSRVRLEQALRGALDRGELSVYYQPIVSLAEDRLSGFEALMRWRHPEFGMVSPVDFIPIAEDTGLIVPTGAWLLEEAAHQLVRWRAERPDLDLHMGVNISVRQLRDSTLVGLVGDVLERTGMPPSALWLEITESGAMENPESSLAVLRELRALGVTLCIDDFGTGYSSLSYLRQLPAQIVKIDRSFVNEIGRNPEEEAIVRTVVGLSHALAREVVAEGVETAVQRDWLRGIGCDLVQGYLYGAPRAASAQSLWLEDDPIAPRATTAQH